MAKKSKRLIKQVKGIEKQEEKHFEKIENESGRKDTTPGYWQKEILQFKKQREILEEKLEKLRKDKKFNK